MKNAGSAMKSGILFVVNGKNLHNDSAKSGKAHVILVVPVSMLLYFPPVADIQSS